eukprot:227063-Prorocentrum_minimum.AAC.1
MRPPASWPASWPARWRLRGAARWHVQPPPLRHHLLVVVLEVPHVRLRASGGVPRQPAPPTRASPSFSTDPTPPTRA